MAKFVHKSAIACAIGMVLAASNPAAAITKTVYFAGSGLEVDGDPFGLLGIAPVSRVSGSFSYEVPPTATSDCPSPCGPFHGFHLTGYAYSSFVVEFGELALVGSALGGIGIGDSTIGGRGDFFAVGDNGAYDPAVGYAYQTELRFVGPGDALSSTDIPSVATLNSLARSYPFYFGYTPDLQEGSQSTARFTRMRFSDSPIAEVPLPAELPLILGAMLAIGGVSCWTRRTGPTR